MRDGQEAGEMLLDIETRIGELAEKEGRATTPLRRDERGRVAGHDPSGKLPKYERLGMSEGRMRQSQAIAKYPDIVEKVKAQARENETKIENLLFVIWVQDQRNDFHVKVIRETKRELEELRKMVE